MTRDELINQLLWNSGGHGFGICQVANAFNWAMATPVSPAEDLKSVVAIDGPPELYSDEELARLVEYSVWRTAAYDRMFTVRMGTNMTFIQKREPSPHLTNTWQVKKLTWDHGQWFATFEEAMAFARKIWT